jgi:APA family basic amino acid/polyamine antiporter
MARKLPAVARLLDAPALAAVAYGEIGSSLFLALGIVSLYGLGLTPWVLLAVGLVFVLVALSYAEGVAAMPEPGGAAAFVRRAFNDPAGFATGWVLFLDYLIVIALAGVFVPHYLGGAFEWHGIEDSPWDVVVGVCTVACVAVIRLIRRTRIYRAAIAAAGLALLTQLLVAVLGFAVSFSFANLRGGTHPWTAPSVTSLVFALALAPLAFTGLETVANYAAEARDPGRTLPRSLFVAVGLVVVVTTVVALVGVGSFAFGPDPSAPDGVSSGLGTDWRFAPLVGIAVAVGGGLPDWAADAFRIFVGAGGAVVLLAAISTSFSGAGRLAQALARRDMLPRALGRSTRRSSVAPAAVGAAAVLSCGLIVGSDALGSPIRSLASLYSFGILLAFAAAQLAVIRLRRTEPDLPRPFRVPLALPLVGLPLTIALWVGALATHHGARIGGPIWLAIGACVYVVSRRRGLEGVLRTFEPPVPDLHPDPEGAYGRILVPVKIGEIGEEVLATALRLAQEHQARVDVVHVLRVPMALPLDAPLDEEAPAYDSLADAKEIGAEHGVEIEGEVVRARALGAAIVEKAVRDGADLIVLGSAPRWRRQSRFFSPTVDYVLRNAVCQVMVVAYPQGVLEDEAAG